MANSLLYRFRFFLVFVSSVRGTILLNSINNNFKRTIRTKEQFIAFCHERKIIIFSSITVITKTIFAAVH